MDDIDSLLDRLMVKNNTPQVSYINDQDAEKIEIRNTSSGGDCVFARKKLSVKDPILSLPYPTVVAIDGSFIQKTCYHCLVVSRPLVPLLHPEDKNVDLKLCNGCLFARYCSRECQVKSWNAYHKFECKIFKKLKDNQFPAILRAVLRLVLLKDHKKISDEEWYRITGLVSHQEVFAGKGPSNLTQMAESIQLVADSSMSTDTIFQLILIMRSNATELPDTLNGGIGVMLQPGVAKFNHSCEPNIAVHRPFSTMKAGWINTDTATTFAQVIPLRSISQGEELFLSYIAPTKSVSDRQAELKDSYLFQCSCTRCISDLQALATMQTSHPDRLSKFTNWSNTQIKHVSRLTTSKPSTFRRAANNMTIPSSVPSYTAAPILYTSGIYPDAARTLTSASLTLKFFDETLLNLLRLHLLVDPHRYVGRHNPTNTYTACLLLDILDVITGESKMREVTEVDPTTGRKETIKFSEIEQKVVFQALEKRGVDLSWLSGVREGVKRELLGALKGTAARDLRAILVKPESDTWLLMEQEGDEVAQGEEGVVGVVDEDMLKILGVA